MMPEVMSFRKSTAREYFESIVIAVILALFVRTWVVQAFKIPSGSMEQNLLIGDHLLVNKFVHAPTVSELERTLLPIGEVQRGDVLVFKYPEDPTRDFIKRTIGLPGETIELRQSRVFIDGQPIEEPYLDLMRPGGKVAADIRGEFGPRVVPDGHLFMMGDNRGDSQDSRYWGPLPIEYVKGRAFVLYWSYESESDFYADVGLGATLRRLASGVTHFFTRTRYERLFMGVP
jgi:signal peptidase I